MYHVVHPPMGCGNFNKSSSLFFAFVTSCHRVVTLTQWAYAASPALALAVSKEQRSISKVFPLKYMENLFPLEQAKPSPLRSNPFFLKKMFYICSHFCVTNVTKLSQTSSHRSPIMTSICIQPMPTSPGHETFFQPLR